MRIKVLRKTTSEGNGSSAEQVGSATTTPGREGAIAKTVSHRRFLKGVAGALGLIGMAQLSSARPASATTDVVEIDGTLTVADKIGVGRTPETSLHLNAGAVKIGTRVIADEGGCYYA